MKLLENIKGNFYFSYSQPIEFIENSRKHIYDNEIFIEIYKGLGKEKYKKNFLNYTGNPSFNYIYQFNNLNFFEFTVKDILFGIKNGFINENIILQKLQLVNIADIFQTKQSRLYELSNDIMSIKKVYGESLFNMSIFKRYYDGFSRRFQSSIHTPRAKKYLSEPNCYLIFFDKALLKAKLVDGNAVRFQKNQDEFELNIPEVILNDLERYTNSHSKRLNVETKKWLEENFKLPYQNVKLYRSIAFNTFDANKLIKMIGVNFDKIKKENNVILSRRKESSWSYNPEIARHFSYGFSSDDLNILFKANISADDILIDFTKLPKKYQKHFFYIHQNEVIVKSKKINAKIADIDISKKFENWLMNRGFLFKNNIGIIKI